MEYGPEHSMLIHQVFGEETDSGDSHWERWARGASPHFTYLRDRPDRDRAPKAKPSQGYFGSLLHAIHRHTLGRFLGRR